jgi:hypothetical protein
VLELHLLGRPGNPSGFIGIKRRRFPRPDIAEATIARAYRPQNEKSGCPSVETLPPVGAICRLAYGIQSVTFEQAIDTVITCTREGSYPQPSWFALRFVVTSILTHYARRAHQVLKVRLCLKPGSPAFNQVYGKTHDNQEKAKFEQEIGEI